MTSHGTYTKEPSVSPEMHKTRILKFNISLGQSRDHYTKIKHDDRFEYCYNFMTYDNTIIVICDLIPMELERLQIFHEIRG